MMSSVSVSMIPAKLEIKMLTLIERCVLDEVVSELAFCKIT